MQPRAIDHVIVAVPDLAAAVEPWRRLGLIATGGTRHPGHGTENAVIFVGDSPETMIYIEFLTVYDPDLARQTARGRALLAAIDGQPGLFRVVLDTEDLAAAQRKLEGAGAAVERAAIAREDGSRIGDVLSFGGANETSNDPRLITYATPVAERFAARKARGAFASTFPLARLDHLALVPDGLERTTAFWGSVLEIPVFGEVRAPGLIIQQMRVGDAIIEFLAPDGPDSRLAGAAPGLRSMLAFEVDDLSEAVEAARGRGFTPSEPGPGPLPGTRVATIPGPELGGVALQLLEYV